MTVNNCICIGVKAEAEEDYTFCFTIPTTENSYGKFNKYYTVMSPEEFEIVNKVVKRAIETEDAK